MESMYAIYIRQMFTHLGLVVTYVGGVIFVRKIGVFRVDVFQGRTTDLGRTRTLSRTHINPLPPTELDSLNRWKLYFKLVLIN